MEGSLTSITPASLATATWITLAFMTALFVGAKVLPGKKVLGFPLRDGQRLTYKVNGMGLWVATHMFVIAGTLEYELSLSPLVTHFWSLFVVANVVSVVMSLILLQRGRAKLRPDARGGRLTDFWYGAELNPTWLGVDVKTWAYHPSLIGLSLLNVAFGYAQYESLGHLTPQMWGYQVFWWLYMTSHYHYEPGVLSMWDVMAEKFGFMLVWGDLSLVPFFYCLPGWFIVSDATPLGWGPVAALAGLHGFGLWIFRGANAQKDRFKRDRNTTIWGRPAETVGDRLLVSGWWGIGRKINYSGEIMVYFSFALCSGFHSIVPYLLPLWLCCLLPHRAWRDEKRCREKYGKLWEAYTRKAKFRMVPFLY